MTDPIFAAIEKREAALARLNHAIQIGAPSSVEMAADLAERRALQALCKTVPTSWEGLERLATFAADNHEEHLTDRSVMSALWLTIAKAAKKLATVGRVTAH